MAEGRRSGNALFFLASFILGSNQPADGLIYQPVLQPSEAAPLIGTYTLKTTAGKSCLKATIGVEYIVIKTKPWYFNLDPTRVNTSGYCGDDAAVLSLTLPNNTASLQFTFKKEGNVSYVTRLTAHIFPVCNGCASQSYQGVVTNEKLFSAAYGQSFKCNSQSVFVMAEELSIKLVPLQIQAFTVPEGQYGQEVECWADFSKWAILIVVGAVVVSIILIAMLTFLFIKDHRRPGYSRI